MMCNRQWLLVHPESRKMSRAARKQQSPRGGVPMLPSAMHGVSSQRAMVELPRRRKWTMLSTANKGTARQHDSSGMGV